MGIDGAQIKQKRIKAEQREAERMSLLVRCPACNTNVSKNAGACPRCGHPMSDAGVSHGVTDSSTICGAAGTIFLGAGVFCPIISLPIVGNINLFANGKGDGVALLIFSIVSLFCIFIGRKRLLIYTGAASMIMLGFVYYSFISRMNDVTNQMNADLSGNPFRGLADVAINSVQMQWGWGALIVGACLLIAAGFIDLNKK